jgi:hypothetical protein
MDMHTLKLLELFAIIGLVGYFFLRQRRATEDAKRETEAKREQDSAE